MGKQTFTISVEWMMVGEFAIEADSLSEAIDEAYQRQDFPEKKYYVDNSFRVQSGLQNQKQEGDGK